MNEMSRRGFISGVVPAVLPVAVMAVPLPQKLSQPKYKLKDRFRSNTLPQNIYKIISVIVEESENGFHVSYRFLDEQANYPFVVPESGLLDYFQKI